MHVPGEIHYPANVDLTLPREFDGHPCFRDFFSDNGRYSPDSYLRDIYPRDMEMLRLSTSATHAAYLIEPRMRRNVAIEAVDRAIEVSYHTNDTFVPSRNVASPIPPLIPARINTFEPTGRHVYAATNALSGWSDSRVIQHVSPTKVAAEIMRTVYSRR
ncbi:hypothetical protein D9619_011497 [Psilocybe cf. subviscida]|uniref:Uncharacterized protein n=1 Tax=Psilocybe cf. subviscida TaxID=2480587 RepID=A0A8H5FA62_9AGAR|nr:hypothetical protein D9619_011497 [Psilocybe cf. subviscida]